MEQVVAGKSRVALGGRVMARVGSAEAAAALLAIFFALASLAWIRMDLAPPMWDEAQYLKESVLLSRALRDQGPATFLAAFSQTMGIKAPLITALPIPAYALLGEGMQSARSINVLFVVLASFALFRLGKVMVGGTGAALAVLFLNTFPLVAGLSRPLMVEYALMTVVILSIYCLARWQLRGGLSAALALGVLVGFGMLLKVTFPLYVGVPALLVFGEAMRDVRSRRAALKALCVVAGVGAAIAALWYGRNWRSVIGFVAEGGFGNVARIFTRSLGEYWRSVADDGLGFLSTLVLASVVVGWSLAAAKGIRAAWIARQHLGVWLAWWIVPAVALSFAVNRDTRYVVPYLPAIALLLGAGCARLAGQRLGRVVLGLIVAGTLANYWMYSFAADGPGGRAQVMGFDVPSRGDWARAPISERWPGEDIVALVDADSRALGLQAPTVTALFTHLRVNAHNLGYQAAFSRSPAKFRIWYMHAMQPQAAARAIVREADYVLTQRPLATTPDINRQSAQVVDLLRKEALPFRTIADFPLPDGTTISLSRARRHPPPLRAYRLPAAAREPTIVVDPGAPRFGEWIHLESSSVTCEDTGCVITLAWRCIAPMREDYRVFVHVYDDAGDVVNVADYTPTRGKVPTSLWRPGEVVEDEIPVSVDLRRGHQVYVGWYRLEPRWRLPLAAPVPFTRGRPNALRIH